MLFLNRISKIPKNSEFQNPIFFCLPAGKTGKTAVLPGFSREMYQLVFLTCLLAQRYTVQPTIYSIKDPVHLNPNSVRMLKFKVRILYSTISKSQNKNVVKAKKSALGTKMGQIRKIKAHYHRPALSCKFW